MPNDGQNDAPKPEVLAPKSDSVEVTTESLPDSQNETVKKLTGTKHITYRPSHKATFIGLAVVAGILAINATILGLVMKSQVNAEAAKNQSEVTLSTATLDSLGVSRNTVGDVGTQLVVNPNSQFNGDVTIAKNVQVSGQLKLNSKFVAADASLAKLQAGDTAVEKININGDATASTLNLRKDLTVVGTTKLQGPVTVSQLMTVNNNLNVAGSLAVGGTLSVRNLQVSSLVSDTTLTIGGHIITRGSAPSVGPGSSLGSNGTVSISGNDASGTVAVNVGAGGGSGILAQVAFRQNYASTPHVVVTQVGQGGGGVFISRSVGGFSIGVNGSLPPGGYAFDYIVMQ